MRDPSRKVRSGPQGTWTKRTHERRTAQGKAQPHEFDFEETDQYVDDLFEGWLKKDNERRARAQIKRWCKTQTVFRLKGDEEGRWRTVKALYSGKVKQYLVAKYGDKIECVANEWVPA